MNPMMASCACGLTMMVPYLLAAGGLVVAGVAAAKYLLSGSKRQDDAAHPHSLAVQPR